LTKKNQKVKACDLSPKIQIASPLAIFPATGGCSFFLTKKNQKVKACDFSPKIQIASPLAIQAVLAGGISENGSEDFYRLCTCG